MGDTISNGDLSILDDLERKALWLASWTVHDPTICVRTSMD